MFTGQERDGGTLDLDYFNARHFSAVLGRFTQVDPGGAGADVLNPQTWNGYAYVGGNPLGMVDPSGMEDCSVNSDFCITGYGYRDGYIPTDPIGGDGGGGSLRTTYNGTDPDHGTDPAFYGGVTVKGPVDTVTVTVDTKLKPIPPKSGTTVSQKLACAAKFGNDYSVGALFGGGKVAMFFGGNTVSSLTNLGLAVTGNGPAPQYPGAIALGGPALGLPVNDALRFAGRQTIPQLTSASGFVRGQALQTVFKAATGTSSLTTLSGEAALQGGITASEFASGVALAKFGYDVGSFAYGYFFACGE